MPTYIYKNELYHHGIKGQKWGIRRFQNTDGSYTAEGRQRRLDSYPDDKGERRKKIAKRVAIGAAVVGGTILAAYGGYKLNKKIQNAVNVKNLALSLHTGSEFANTFIDTVGRPEHTASTTPGYDMTRYSSYQSIGNRARGPLATEVSEIIYANRGGQFSQLKRARQLDQVRKGKKTVADIFNYKDTMKKTLESIGWNKGADDWLSRALRDLDNGGFGKISRFANS